MAISGFEWNVLANLNEKKTDFLYFAAIFKEFMRIG